MDCPLQQERCCGAVVYTMTETGVQYLLVRSMEGRWGFPKGHAEPGETELATASREIQEETGLRVRFLDGFRTTDAYTVTRRSGPAAAKRVVYFLAEYEKQDFHPQETEISEIRLMDFDSAMAALPFESARRILTEANDFLRR